MIWAISPDKPEGLGKMRDQAGLDFPLLVDESSAAIEAYGILNERHGKVPHPTVVIVDMEGVVRFFHLDENYRRRPAPSVLLDALRELEEPADE